MKKGCGFKSITAMIFIVSILFLMPFASALGETKQFDKTKPIKGQIDIVDNWGLPFISTKKADYTITSWTDICQTECSGEFLVNLYSSDKIFSDMKFKNKKGTKSAIEQGITYQLFINSTEDYQSPIYSDNCSNFTSVNGTQQEICNQYVSSYETKIREIMIPYNYETKQAGTYKVKIEGTKKPYETIDVIPYAQDLEFIEWANWTTADCKGIGGAVAIDGDYCVHTFISNSSFNSSIGINSTDNMSILVVAGGGGGGAGWGAGGGGGAGGIVYNSSYGNFIGNQTIIIGSYGISVASSVGGNGGNSSFGNIIAVGGGGGGYGSTQATTGGSGGGGAGLDTANINPGLSIQTNLSGIGYGFRGGYGTGAGTTYAGGGGGGAGSVGVDGTSGISGAGGNGSSGIVILRYLAGGTKIINSTLNSPVNNYNSSTNTISFNCSASGIGGTQISNITFYFWNGTGAVTLSNEIPLTGTSNSTTYQNSFFTDGNWTWNCLAGGNDGTSDWGDANRTFTVDTTAPTVSITNPTANQIFSSGLNIALNHSQSDSGVGLDSCWYSLDGGANVSMASCNNVTFNTTVGDHYLFAYANDTVGNTGASARVNFTVVNVSTTYSFDSRVIETFNETFTNTIDKSSTVSATGVIYYDGTPHNMTNASNVFTASFDIPYNSADAENNSVIYSMNFTFNGNSQVFNTTSVNQTADRFVFALCNATYSIPYINVTFKDQSTGTAIKGSMDSSSWVYNPTGNNGSTKTLSFINATDNTNYTFCAYPVTSTFQNAYTLRYSSDDGATYPQMTYVGDHVMTNASQTLVLYLVPSTVGQYVSFQVTNLLSQPINAVNVDFYASISGSNVLVGTKATDSSGIVTYYMDPLTTYTIIFTKSGYVTHSETIAPTQTQYTVTMSETDATNTTNYNNGISLALYPLDNYLEKNTNYLFGMYINANDSNLDSYSYNITYINGTLISAGDSGTTATGENMTETLNTTEKDFMVLTAYWIVDGETMSLSKTFVISSIDDTTHGIKQFGDDLRLYLNAGDLFGMNDFAVNLIIFVIILTITGICSYSFGLYSPAAISLLVFAQVAFFDAGLGLIYVPFGATNIATILVGFVALVLIVREVSTQ